NSRLLPACAKSASLPATPPAWSITSHDQTCTRSSLKPMTAALGRMGPPRRGLYTAAAGRDTAPLRNPRQRPGPPACYTRGRFLIAAGRTVRHNDRKSILSTQRAGGVCSPLEVVGMRRGILAVAVLLSGAA